jgi:hypothetical protein
MWRGSGLEVHRQIFLSEKAIFHQGIKEAKVDYLKGKVTTLANQPKQLWRTLNSSLGRKKIQSLPSHDSPYQLAQLFNEFFLEKISLIRNGAGISQSSPPLVISSIGATLSSFDPVTAYEIKRLVTRSPTKSDVIDPIPTWLLKRHLEIFLPGLVILVNCALEHGMPVQSFIEEKRFMH